LVVWDVRHDNYSTGALIGQETGNVEAGGAACISKAEMHDAARYPNYAVDVETGILTSMCCANDQKPPST